MAHLQGPRHSQRTNAPTNQPNESTHQHKHTKRTTANCTNKNRTTREGDRKTPQALRTAIHEKVPPREGLTQFFLTEKQDNSTITSYDGKPVPAKGSNTQTITKATTTTLHQRGGFAACAVRTTLPSGFSPHLFPNNKNNNRKTYISLKHTSNNKPLTGHTSQALQREQKPASGSS